MKTVVLQSRVSEEDHALFTIRAASQNISLSAWVRAELLAAAGHITESVKTRHIDKARRVVEGSSTRQDIQQASILSLRGTSTKAQCALNRPARRLPGM